MDKEFVVRVMGDQVHWDPEIRMWFSIGFGRLFGSLDDVVRAWKKYEQAMQEPNPLPF